VKSDSVTRCLAVRRGSVAVVGGVVAGRRLLGGDVVVGRLRSKVGERLVDGFLLTVECDSPGVGVGVRLGVGGVLAVHVAVLLVLVALAVALALGLLAHAGLVHLAEHLGLFFLHVDHLLHHGLHLHSIRLGVGARLRVGFGVVAHVVLSVVREIPLERREVGRGGVQRRLRFGDVLPPILGRLEAIIEFVDQIDGLALLARDRDALGGRELRADVGTRRCRRSARP